MQAVGVNAFSGLLYEQRSGNILMRYALYILAIMM